MPTVEQAVALGLRYLQEAEAAITAGRVRAVLVLPRDLERRVLDSGDALPAGQWLVDASDNIVTSAIVGLRNMPLNLRGADLPRATPTCAISLRHSPLMVLNDMSAMVPNITSR